MVIEARARGCQECPGDEIYLTSRASTHSIARGELPRNILTYDVATRGVSFSHGRVLRRGALERTRSHSFNRDDRSARGCNSKSSETTRTERGLRLAVTFSD